MLKACWKRVGSNLNRFKLLFHLHTTFPLFSKMLNGVEAVWTFRPTFVQYLPNIRSTFVGWMLVKCWNECIQASNYPTSHCFTFNIFFKKITSRTYDKKKKKNTLPYWRIKPNVEHLVRVTFQRDWGAPLQVTCYASRSKALLDPSPSNMASVRGPRS